MILKASCFLNFLLMIYVLITPATIAAQRQDTVQKYANGNILVKKFGAVVVKSPVGIEIGELQAVFKGDFLGERKMVFRNEEFKKIHLFQNNIHKYGLFNFSTGAIVIPPLYDNIRVLNEEGAGIVTTQSGEKYGAVSLAENKTIDPVYRGILSLNSYKDLLFLTDTVTYILNSKLQITGSISGMKDLKMLPRKHRGTFYHVAVLTHGEALITNDYKLVQANMWKWIAGFTGDFLVAATNKGLGLFNMTTQKITEPCQFRSYQFRAFDNQQVLLGRPGLWKLFDSTGKQLMRIAADSVVPALNEWGGFYFKKNGLWGVASVKGNILMKPSWKELDLPIYTNITVTLPDGTRKDYYFEFTEEKGEIEITAVREGSQVIMREN